MSVQRLVWHEQFRFTGVDSWGHEVEIDGDPQGSGSKPSDLLPLSLAACAAYDIVNILRKQRQELRSLEAEIESEQDDASPHAFRRIRVHYRAGGAVDEQKARRALELAEGKYCSISATLRAAVALEFSISVEQ